MTPSVSLDLPLPIYFSTKDHGQSQSCFARDRKSQADEGKIKAV